MAEANFVKEIEGRGYSEGSKQIDQEVDLEIYLHLFKHNKETYISLQRGKHRISTIIPDDLKYMLLKFPSKMPIPDDLNKPCISYRKLPSPGNSPGADELFTFG